MPAVPPRLPLTDRMRPPSAPDSVTLVAQDRGEVPPQERGAVMDGILEGACLVDFALLDANHHLLLGR
jgi:hypothetical protein